MRRLLIGSGALAATLLLPMALPTPLAQGAVAAEAAPMAQARVIVKYRADAAIMRKQALSADGQRTLQAQSLGDRIGVALTAGRALTERSHVVTASGVGSAQLAARIGAESDVEYAVVDERRHIVAVPDDPFYATRPYNLPVAPTSGGPLVGQWYLKPPGAAGTAANTAPAAINAEQAWDITVGSANVVVAVLDTGLRADHPDLQSGNVLPGYDMVSADSDGSFSTANDGNGRDADPSDPGDAVTSADKSNPVFAGSECVVEDSSWHGTQTLGLIGATTNNGVGIASVGRNVRVMPVRVLGKCGGYDSDIVAGMRWASAIAVPGLPANPNKARVINMSLGGSNACSQVYRDAMTELTAAGVVVVVSAGNSAGHAVSSPANCPNVVAVSGLRHVGSKVGFADLGSEIAISAPAGNCINIGAGEPCLYPIMTTSNSGKTAPVAGAAGGIYTDSYRPSLGTSFSSPLVAGAVALMLSAQPALTPAEVKAKLRASARPFPTSGGSAAIAMCTAPGSADQLECYCTTAVCGAGMLDVRAAVLAAAAVQARISVTTATPTAGQSVNLTSSSLVGAGQSVAAYAWTIVDAGTTGAAIVGANNGDSVTVMPTAAGTFTIQLTTTDGSGGVSTASSTVTVTAAAVTPVVTPVVTPPAGTTLPVTPAPSSSSDSGGGALGVGWLLLLLSAVLALAAASRREQRQAARLSAAALPSRKG